MKKIIRNVRAALSPRSKPATAGDAGADESKPKTPAAFLGSLPVPFVAVACDSRVEIIDPDTLTSVLSIPVPSKVLRVCTIVDDYTPLLGVSSRTHEVQGYPLHVVDPTTVDTDSAVLHTLPNVHKRATYGLASPNTPSQAVVVSGSDSGDCMCVWSASTGKILCDQLPDAPKDLYRIAAVPEWGPKGILSGGWGDFVIKQHDVLRMACVGRFVGHTSGLWGVDAIAGKNLLVSSSTDNHFRLWDCATHENTESLHLHCGSWSLRAHPQRGIAVAGLSNGNLVGIDIRKSSEPLYCTQTVVNGAKTIFDIAAVRGNTFVAASASGSVFFFDATTGTIEATVALDVSNTGFPGGCTGVCVGCPEDGRWGGEVGVGRREKEDEEERVGYMLDTMGENMCKVSVGENGVVLSLPFYLM